MKNEKRRIRKVIALFLSMVMVIAGVVCSPQKRILAEETKAIVIDFGAYSGTNEDPGILLDTDVEREQEYTLSFSYYVDDDSMGTSVINAAEAWNKVSQVSFSNNILSGKGEFKATFTADYEKMIPVIQTNKAQGTPKVYIWDLKLVKKGTEVNLYENVNAKSFAGETSLVLETTIDPSKLGEEESKVILFNFADYEGPEENPNAVLCGQTESGNRYTFSFSYRVEGESTGTRIINALNEWGSGSNVIFENGLLTGAGVYTTTFEADYTEVWPTFQTSVPVGKPKLYVWNIKLIKEGTNVNILKNYSADSFIDNFNIVSEYSGNIGEETTSKTEETTTSMQNTTTKPVTTTKPATTTKPETVKKPGKAIIKTVKNNKKKSVTLKWGQVKNAKKYQVQYSLNNKFKTQKKYKTKTITTNKLSYTIKKLTKKKKYFFRVRGINGKKYGDWSKPKHIKITK